MEINKCKLLVSTNTDQLQIYPQVSSFVKNWNEKLMLENVWTYSTQLNKHHIKMQINSCCSCAAASVPLDQLA